jgi:hypothetical protein
MGCFVQLTPQKRLCHGSWGGVHVCTQQVHPAKNGARGSPQAVHERVARFCSSCFYYSARQSDISRVNESLPFCFQLCSRAGRVEWCLLLQLFKIGFKAFAPSRSIDDASCLYDLDLSDGNAHVWLGLAKIVYLHRI